MLNELHSLEQGLAAYGVASVARHPDLSALLKGDVFRVRLDADGCLDEVELLPARDRQEIWTLRDGKHNGFPGLKTAGGLLALTEASRAEHDEHWRNAKSAAAKRTEIERLLGGVPLDVAARRWPKPGHRARIAERLADLKRLDDDPRTAAVPAVFARFLAAASREPSLLEGVLIALAHKVRTDTDDWLDPVRKALVEAMPIAIDVARDPQFRRDAGDPRQIENVSIALQGAPAQASGTDMALHCALSGTSGQLLDGPFPQPTLPSLGISFLFSRNKDIPAMGRYGRIGPGSLPIDAGLASRLSGALVAVTEEARRGRTWRLLPAESGDKQDLLIAFAEASPDLPVASAVGHDSIEEEADRPDESDVERGGEAALSLYEGLAEAKPHSMIRFLLLRAVDPANRKALIDRRSTAAKVLQAALVWSRAMSNAPAGIGWPIFVKRRQAMARPSAQAPLSLTGLSRKLYIRGGREATEAPGLPASEALALFLDEGSRVRRALRILRHLLGRHQMLLAGLAHAIHRSELPDFDPRATVRRDGLRSIAWMSALLFFLGRTREIYMEDAGFKFGQLLAAMDAVHMGYCADVRGNQIPPTLIGNSVFSTAGRDPVRALDMLAVRWKPYGAWARRTDNVRERAMKASDSLRLTILRGLAQARLAGKLSDELHKVLAETAEQPSAVFRKPDECFRAELLLGYLAGVKPIPKSNHGTAAAIDDDGENQG